MIVGQAKPIDVYYWSTPNGRKITVMLEELAVPYSVRFVDLEHGEQRTPEFAAISPNRQIPAIVDPEGPGGAPISIFEFGAILLYLGRKFRALYPQDDERRRVEVETWLMWQMGNFGPFLGQAHHFNLAAPEEVPYAIERYRALTHRLYAVLEARLAGRDFITDAYSIADIAIYCWAARHERHRVELAAYPNVQRWFMAIGDRSAVQRGMAVIKPGHHDRATLNPARQKSQVSGTGKVNHG